MLKDPIVIPLEEDVCHTIQYLFYLSDSYAEILKDIISNKRNINANKELLNYYNELYTNAHLEYKIFQEELVNSLYEIPAETKASFYVDFMRQEIVITDLIPVKMENKDEI